MTISKTIVLSLTSGANVITEIVGETESTYLLRHPFELIVDLSMGEYQTVQFARYLPFNSDGLVAVSKSGVVSLAICSERFSVIYGKKVQRFEELNSNIDELDEQALIQEAADRAADEEYPDYESDNDLDDYDPSEASPLIRNRTIH